MKTKARPAIILQVDLTQYGWRVSEGNQSHGLFISKDKALVRLKDLQKALKVAGKTSKAIVTAAEDPPYGYRARIRRTV